MSATSHMARMCAAFFIGFAMLVATGCGGGSGGGGGDGGTTPVTSNGVATCLPTSVAFGAQAINVATAPTTITISNTGSQDLDLAALTITGSGASAFTITQPAQSVLAPNATTTFTVVFTPTAVAAYSATVNVPVSDTKDRGTTVRVSGNGITSQTGVVSPTPTSLDFGTIVVNENSAAQTVTVTNTGNSTLTFSSSASGAVTVTGAGAAAFQVTQMNVTTLAPSASATFTVVFQPLAIQQYTATVLITALSPASSGTVTVTGIGRGPYRVDELVTLIAGDGTNMLTTGRYDYGVVEPPLTATQSFTLTNIAPDGRTVNLKQLYNTEPQYIRIVLNSQITNGGFTSTDPLGEIASGQSTTFVMTYTSSTIERVSARVNIEILGSGNINWILSAGMQDRLYVLGNGLPIEDGDLSPRLADYTDFGSAEVLDKGTVTRVFSINNNQDQSIVLADVELSSISPGGSFEIVSEPANTGNSSATAATITGRGAKTYSLKFNAVRQGLATAMVTVRSSDVMHPNYTYKIQGMALAPKISVYGVPMTYDSYTKQWIEGDPVVIADNKPNFAYPPEYPTGKGNPPVPDNVPSATNGTFLQYNPMGIPRRAKFYIRNDGNSKLELINSPGVIFISGEYHEYQLISAPNTVVLPGEQTSFIIEHMSLYREITTATNRFHNKPGVKSSFVNNTVIRIDSNDPAGPITANGEPNYIHQPYAIAIQAYRNRTALTLQALVKTNDNAIDGWTNFPTLSGVAATPTEDNAAPEYYGNSRVQWSRDNSPLGPTIPHGQVRAKLENGSDFGSVQKGGFETREFILRNDWTDQVQLSGSPLVNITGVHSSDYQMEIIGMYDAAGVCLSDANQPNSATQPSATTRQWFENNPKPILGYRQYLRFSVTFRPTDPGARTCKLEILTGVRNIVTGEIEKADPILNNPEFNQTYTAFFNGMCLGPKVMVTSEEGNISRSAKFTFRTECFICDRANPSATSATFQITNVGNQDLDLGQNVDDQVRCTDRSGEDAEDFTITQPTQNGVPSYRLRSGETATFVVTFEPRPKGEKDPTTEETPEESQRTCIVTIQTSDAPASNPQHRDGYIIFLEGMAIDPRMRVKGHGQLIYDCDFNPRDTEVKTDLAAIGGRSFETVKEREWDDTVYRDMDMWGGQDTHTYLLRNDGNKHLLEILDPVWFDNEEIIRSVLPKAIYANTAGNGMIIEMPGLQNISATAPYYRIDPITYERVDTETSREFGTRHFLQDDPSYPQLEPDPWIITNRGHLRDVTLNTYASVLSRIRIGDEVVGRGRITSATPDMRTVCNTPVTPRDLCAPEDILRLRNNNPETYLPHGAVDDSTGWYRTVSRDWVPPKRIHPLENAYVPRGERPYRVVGEPWSGNEDTVEGWFWENPFAGQFRYRTDTPVVGSVNVDESSDGNVRTDPAMYIERTTNDMTGDGDVVDANDKAIVYSPLTLNRFKDRDLPRFPAPGVGDWVRIWNPAHDGYWDYLIVQKLFGATIDDPIKDIPGDLIGAYCYNKEPVLAGYNEPPSLHLANNMKGSLPVVPRMTLRLVDIFIENVNGLTNGGFRVNTADATTKQALTYLKPGFNIQFYPTGTTPVNGDLYQTTGVSNDPERAHYIDDRTSLPWPDQDKLDPAALPEHCVLNDATDPSTGFLDGVSRPKARPKCYSFTVSSVDVSQGIIRVLQSSEETFASLKSDSNWGDGPNTPSSSATIIKGLTGDGLKNDTNPADVATYEPVENGHFSATTPHRTMVTIGGNAYYQGTFVAVIPLQFDIIDSNTSRVSFVKRDIEVVGYQRTDATGTQVTPPFNLAPGEEVAMKLRVRPRWSTGFDRWNLGMAWYLNWAEIARPSPFAKYSRGWDSYDMSLAPQNMDADNTSRFPLSNENHDPGNNPRGNEGSHPMGEHMVNVNIGNTDIDVYNSWQTGILGSWIAMGQRKWTSTSTITAYEDEATPRYEFSTLIESRDSRIRISVSQESPLTTEPRKFFESHHPNFYPDTIAARFEPDLLSGGSTPVGGDPIVWYITIENGSPWLKGPTPSLTGTYGGNGGDGYVIMGVQSGLLRLDTDKIMQINNNTTDYTVERVGPIDGNIPYFALEDRDKNNHLQLPYISPESGRVLTNTEKMVYKLTFRPTSLGNRYAYLTIASNDASHPTLILPVLMKGDPPPVNN